MSAEPRLVEVEDLAVCFGSGRGGRAVVRAVDGVSLHVDRGEVLGVVGESGSGKSTLGRAILGVHRPARGEVRLAGRSVSAASRGELRELRRHAQIVFQDPFSSLNPRMTVGDTIAEPLLAHKLGDKQERAARVLELLGDVGLPERTRASYPHELSGGQRQRVAIARALALRPELVIADEAVSALDVSVQAQIIALLGRLREERNLAYVFISHDLAVIASISDRVIVMYRGTIVEELPAAAIVTAPRHPYTVALMSAAGVPDPDRERERERIVLSTPPPGARADPVGCRFADRCWLRPLLDDAEQERCATVEPAAAQVAVDHRVRCHFVEEAERAPVRKRVLAGLSDTGDGRDLCGQPQPGVPGR